MFSKRTRVALAALLAACLIGAAVLDDYDSGILGVISYTAYFGQALLAVTFIVSGAVALARRARGRASA